MTESTAIETQALTKVYGSGHTEVVAMRDATLSVKPAQCVALIGPSGAGKSTFLTAVGLINPPTAGSIRIGGRLVMNGLSALTNARTFRRKHIGYISQKANLIRFLTALENVQIAMELNGEAGRTARRRAIELLEYLGVGERADGYPPELSGGEQQRVAVARAGQPPERRARRRAYGRARRPARAAGHGAVPQSRARARRGRNRRDS